MVGRLPDTFTLLSHVNTLILCYAPEDAVLALTLADYLEINLPLTVSRHEAVVGPELDLLAAAERALSAEAALVFLSPASVPQVWDRKKWEPVFFAAPKELESRLGIIFAAPCKFPELLRREAFFDATGDPLTAARAVRTWLLHPDHPVRPLPSTSPEVEALRRELADKPGTLSVPPELAEELLLTFAHDFGDVLHLDCSQLNQTSILGEIASAIGLRLPGSTAQMQTGLDKWFIGHRMLLVLESISAPARDSFHRAGLASAIFTTRLSSELPAARTSRAAEALRRFHASFDALESGWIALSLLRAEERNAEALELLAEMKKKTAPHDAATLTRISREKFWTLHDLEGGGGGETPAGTAATLDAQLALPFA